MRFLILLALVGLQFPLSAQTMLRYHLTTTSPGSTGITMGPDGPKSVQIDQTVTNSVLTVISRDSAGGTAWEMVVDSVVQSREILDSAMARSSVPARATIAPLKPVTYRLFATTGTPMEQLLKLLAKQAGLGMLTPNAGIPSGASDTKTDSSSTTRDTPERVMPAANRGNGMTVAASTLMDTVLVRWIRTAPETIDVTINNRMVSRSTDGSAMNGTTTGTIRIVLDTRSLVTEARLTTTTQTSRKVGQFPDMQPTVIKLNASAVLVRVP